MGAKKTGKCVIDDDMQDIYAILYKADIVLLSSPIFFYGMTSQIKSLIDRAQAMWWKTRIDGKTIDNTGKGYLIAAGATKGKNLFEGVQLVSRYFFDALAMRYEGGLFFRGMESYGDAENNSEAMQKTYNLGKDIVI